METLRTQINKTLTDKKQTSERKRILLIEEEKNSALATVLAEEGYNVVRCDSVQKAWSLVYPHRPKIIVLHPETFNAANLADFQECHALAQGIPIVLAISNGLKRDCRNTPHGVAAVVALSSTAESIREKLHSLAGETEKINRPPRESIVKRI